MVWHAQVTSYTLRQYDTPGGYERREPYKSVATIFMLGDDVAFVHAFLNADKSEISRAQWRELRDYLRDDLGIKKVRADRHGFDASYETQPMPL